MTILGALTCREGRGAVAGRCGRGRGGRHHRRRLRGPLDDSARAVDRRSVRRRGLRTLDGDRSYLVTTPDGVPLAVREVGPADAPLTVVFAHGFCLRMGAFHFQRMRLSEQWGPQVRMVFYDQRGHGRSGRSSTGDLHRDAAGQGPGDRAAGDRAARPGRVGRPFDGRDDGAVARPAVPAALRQPDRRRGADLVCGRRGGPVAAG